MRTVLGNVVMEAGPDHLKFFVTGKCGKKFKKPAAIIVEPLSPNPGLCFPMPSHTLGLHATELILTLYRTYETNKKRNVGNN